MVSLIGNHDVFTSISFATPQPVIATGQTFQAGGQAAQPTFTDTSQPPAIPDDLLSRIAFKDEENVFTERQIVNADWFYKPSASLDELSAQDGSEFLHTQDRISKNRNKLTLVQATEDPSGIEVLGTVTAADVVVNDVNILPTIRDISNAVTTNADAIAGLVIPNIEPLQTQLTTLEASLNEVDTSFNALVIPDLASVESNVDTALQRVSLMSTVNFSTPQLTLQQTQFTGLVRLQSLFMDGTMNTTGNIILTSNNRIQVNPTADIVLLDSAFQPSSLRSSLSRIAPLETSMNTVTNRLNELNFISKTTIPNNGTIIDISTNMIRTTTLQLTNLHVTNAAIFENADISITKPVFMNTLHCSILTVGGIALQTIIDNRITSFDSSTNSFSNFQPQLDNRYTKEETDNKFAMLTSVSGLQSSITNLQSSITSLQNNLADKATTSQINDNHSLIQTNITTIDREKNRLNGVIDNKIPTIEREVADLTTFVNTKALIVDDDNANKVFRCQDIKLPRNSGFESVLTRQDLQTQLQQGLNTVSGTVQDNIVTLTGNSFTLPSSPNPIVFVDNDGRLGSATLAAPRYDDQVFGAINRGRDNDVADNNQQRFQHGLVPTYHETINGERVGSSTNVLTAEGTWRPLSSILPTIESVPELSEHLPDFQPITNSNQFAMSSLVNGGTIFYRDVDTSLIEEHPSRLYHTPARVNNLITNKLNDGTISNAVIQQVEAQTITAFSDARLKQDIKPLDKTTQHLKPKSFKYLNQPDTTRYGFVAQDVQEHYPELVEQGDKYLSVKYLDIIALLVNEVAELRSRIEKCEGIL